MWNLNKVTDYSPLGKLQRRESLDLSACQQLRTLKPIGPLSELRHLSLGDVRYRTWRKRLFN